MHVLTALAPAALNTSAAVIAGPALARIPQGCFARDYPVGHPVKKTKHHVASLRISPGPAPRGNGYVTATGRFSGQGRASTEGIAKRSCRQIAFCGETGGKTTCQVECDGSSFTIRSAQGDSLEIETHSFTRDVPGVGAEEGCGGLSDLPEEGSGKTTCRLTRAPASACPGLE
ncbi:hypothetical protein [Pseudogemmobacter bohemicus]|uniref:hypothetical protein n=1 Tax=Pseudogemmobacter bohemicus TaxID=2250708 RepID=UPI000DD3C725|nr:hypothetical protein [Pseudogemmobacter bohemicus]